MDFIRVSSSTVDEIAYDEFSQELHVVFLNDNRYYVYSNVPRHVFQDFTAAPSKGKFIHQVLKADRYPCRRVR